MLDTLHECLLRFCLWWMRFDYWLATRTGRNPANISQLSVDIVRMETDLHRLRLNRVRYDFEAKRQQLLEEGDI